MRFKILLGILVLVIVANGNAVYESGEQLFSSASRLA